MAFTPGTNRQVPDHSIFDAYDKQAYLGNQYCYTTDDTTIASTSEIPLFLLKNPVITTTAFPAQYVSLFFNLRKLFTLTDLETSVLRFYFHPTVTGAGTPVSPVNLRRASPNVSIAALSIAPTVSANGTLVDFIASTSSVLNQSELMIILDPGQSLLVTVQTSNDPTDISVGLSWYEL